MVSLPQKHPKKPMKTEDIHKLIDKGAPVKKDLVDDEKKWACVNLRFPAGLLEEIDEAVNHIVGISRTGWMLQTLQKELKRLKQKGD